MKYIMIRFTKGATRTLPIIFPEHLTHAGVAAAMAHCAEMQGGEVVSAGFVSFQSDNELLGLEAYGKSESLKLESREEDTFILNMHQYGVGIE